MTTLNKGLVSVAVATVMLTPAATMAQTSHRQQTKNTWRNLAYGSAAVGALGFLTHNHTVGWLGLGGAAYSAYRYEQDRKSQSRAQRYSYVHHLRRRH